MNILNLTEVVVRENDTHITLKRKVQLATILGTIQSTLTNFGFLSEEWVKNTEEERLLGVSLTGIMDNKVMSNIKDGFAFNDFVAATESLPEILESIRDTARETNEKWANMLNIPESAAITCVKNISALAA